MRAIMTLFFLSMIGVIVYACLPLIKTFIAKLRNQVPQLPTRVDMRPRPMPTATRVSAQAEVEITIYELKAKIEAIRAGAEAGITSAKEKLQMYEAQLKSAEDAKNRIGNL